MLQGIASMATGQAVVLRSSAKHLFEYLSVTRSAVRTDALAAQIARLDFVAAHGLAVVAVVCRVTHNAHVVCSWEKHFCFEFELCFESMSFKLSSNRSCE